MSLNFASAVSPAVKTVFDRLWQGLVGSTHTKEEENSTLDTDRGGMGICDVL